MSDFSIWSEQNKQDIVRASRNGLSEMSFNAGVSSVNRPKTLFFLGREITDFKLKEQVRLNKPTGFNFNFDRKEEIDPMSLQILVNENGGIKLIDWIYYSQFEPCLIEFSNGDVIDYSDFAEEEGASTSTQKAFMAYVEFSNTHITIIEVFENKIEDKS